MNNVVVHEKAIELALVARAVVTQLAKKDCTPEGLAAGRLVEEAIDSVFLCPPKNEPVRHRKEVAV